MTDSPPKSSRALLGLGIGVTAAIAVVALFMWLDFRGPRPHTEPPAGIALVVERAGKPGPLAPHATLPPGASLKSTVTLPAPAKVSLVHIDPGHGMEPLLLNAKLDAGTHLLEKNGAPAELHLEGLSGPQVLAAVAAERDLIEDEALSAARGLPVEGVKVAAFEFTVQ
ncbi:MAG: hypothetical protein JST54_13300 [Deltaproteobacteria bacterium]|nr:hypothetical protein [Deltaproteobacteria bacterium]